MQFSVNGFTWEASRPQPGKPLPSRNEALAAMDKVRSPGSSSKFYARAEAAFSVCDYLEVIRCCEAANEISDPARWQ